MRSDEIYTPTHLKCVTVSITRPSAVRGCTGDSCLKKLIRSSLVFWGIDFHAVGSRLVTDFVKFRLKEAWTGQI